MIESDHLVLSALVIANVIWYTPVTVVLVLAGSIRIIRFTIWFFGIVSIKPPPFRLSLTAVEIYFCLGEDCAGSDS